MGIVCQRCGRLNVEGATFCANRDCGEYLSWEGSTPQPEPLRPDEHHQDISVQPEALQQTIAAQIRLEPSTLTAAAGHSASSSVIVYNAGSQVEELTLAADGDSAPWITFRPALLQVYPGASATSVLTFAPSTQDPTPAGQAALTVRAISTLHPTLIVTAQGATEVAAFHHLTASMTPLQTSGRGTTVHNIAVSNAGNSLERVMVHATDPTARLQIGVPPEVGVPLGTILIPVTVRPPRKLFGKRRWHPFQVTITPASTAPPLRVDGTREMKPTFPRWLVIVVILIIAACACGYLTITGLQ